MREGLANRFPLRVPPPAGTVNVAPPTSTDGYSETFEVTMPRWLWYFPLRSV